MEKLNELFSETGKDLLYSADPYLNEKLTEKQIDLMSKYIDSYLTKVKNEILKICQQ